MIGIIESKRGASHIEVILSFVIFLGFLMFLIAMFNPFSSSSRGDNLDYVERAIRNSTEVELEFATLGLESEQPGGKCFYLDYYLKNSIYVKNESLDNLASLNSESRIYLENSGTFFYIYSSMEFVSEAFDIAECKKLKNIDYHLGLYRNYSVISFNKLSLLNQDYNSNYPELKSRLGIKGEFAFNVRDTSRNSILNLNSQGGNVYSREVPIQIVYGNGTLKYAIMTVQTWS